VLDEYARLRSVKFADPARSESNCAARRPPEQAQTRCSRCSFAALSEARSEREAFAAEHCRQADPEICPMQIRARAQAQQEAGIAALITIATQVSIAMSEAPTAIIPSVLAPLPDPAIADASSRHLRELTMPETVARAGLGPLRKLQARLQTDHLVRNSLYLMLSSGLQAAMGFAFWIVMARLFSTADVGRASSLVSATSLIAFFSLFGLNSTLVRYLPTSKARDALISAAIILVAVCGAAFGLLYLLLTPVLAPRLAFVEHRPVMVAGFVLLASAAAVNLLTDSVFIASRKAGYCALTDGAVSGVTKIASGVILAGSGAYGLFCACAAGFATAAIASVALIVTALHWRPSLTGAFQSLKPLIRFSGANYAGSICMLLPTLVVPLIVLDRLGAPAAAYYFVAYQIATLLYSAVYAVEQAFMAEGSHTDADWQATRRRSRRFAIALFVPACLVLTVTAHWVLLTFGARYSQNGTPSLILLALAVIPLAASNWSWTVLRLTGRLRPLVASNGVFALAICGLAWFLAPHGLTALAAAWPIGCLMSAIVATVAVAITPRKARHRRTTRTAQKPRNRGRREPIHRRFAEPR
jgi:O-antigen/teichoic acid export membrane protein